MSSPRLEGLESTFTGPWDPKSVGSAGRMRRFGSTPLLRKSSQSSAGTIGFRGVPEDVWNFHIGGYQVCHKWLKDRKGRTLSDDDIAHYQKIVVAISETIRLMAEIDEVIEEHGGWPGAFSRTEGAA